METIVETIAEMAPALAAVVPVVEEVEEAPAKPVPTKPEKCPSVDPSGIFGCELPVHSIGVPHQFSWNTVDGPRVQYW